MEELTYKKAGVDIDEGDRFVSLISPLARKTFRPEVITDIGSFGALFRLDIKKYRDPVLVSGTDGVGTKLRIAFMMDRHDTVGIDLVAMCVNDILTLGAEPLFFLDYLATGKLVAERAKDVVKGIAKGCEEAGCALIGGETAEMPGFYGENEYDLAGFAVGAVDREEVVDGARISEGDVLIGIVSNGLHSNGYSLVRKVFFEKGRLKPDSYVPELNSALGEELLRPTRIYVRAVNAVREKITVKGMAHITGGGIPGNVPRILREGLTAVVIGSSWPVLPVFDLIRTLGNVPDHDMKRTFNMGIGYVLIVADEDGEDTVSLLRQQGVDAYRIGVIEKGMKENVRYT